MSKSVVAIVRYENPLESVQKAVDLSHGLDHLPANPKVFIKPNILFWTSSVPIPKWGVMTTSRVIEDVVVLLKERGIHDITIGEGMAIRNPKDKEAPAHAFETLGYNVLKERYGIKTINVFERPFEEVDLGDDAHVPEHSLEVQLPFLQVVLKAFTVVPLVVGEATSIEVGEVLDLLWGESETLIVISSDLSHYYDYDTATRLDHATSRAIEALHPEAIGVEQACGRCAIQGLLQVVPRHGLRAETIDVRNSGDTAGPMDRVVGYGAYAFAA